jgi:hypothetical protein
MAVKKTTNLNEQIIFIGSTYLWTMVNFYFLNGILFIIDSVSFFF